MKGYVGIYRRMQGRGPLVPDDPAAGTSPTAPSPAVRPHEAKARSISDEQRQILHSLTELRDATEKGDKRVWAAAVLMDFVLKYAARKAGAPRPRDG